MEGDRVAFVAQKGLPGGHGFKDAALAFFAEVVVDGAMTGDEAHNAFGRWVLRLSQTMRQRISGATEPRRPSRKAAKSSSVRLSPTVLRTVPAATSKAAIRVCVPCRRYSNSCRPPCPVAWAGRGTPSQAPGCRSFRQSIPCAPSAHLPAPDRKPRRHRRIWPRNQDPIWASAKDASNGA